jgi:transposase InsO family protein
MNIKENLKNSKLTLIALDKIIKEYASDMGVDLNGPLATICNAAGVNRTQVYERKNQLEEALAELELAGPGRPSNHPVSDAGRKEPPGWQLREKVLRYRLNYPGAVVVHSGGRATYSDGFIRFILELYDEWEGSPQWFCRQVEVPYSTLRVWCNKDKGQAYGDHQDRPIPYRPISASADFRRIVDDFATWQGGIRDFFKYETVRMKLGPTPIHKVLVICGMLPVRPAKPPRYRGSTTRCQPGNILVTDGKTLKVEFTAGGEVWTFNWQAMVDQATACHTAVVVTETERADGVRDAFESSCAFLGRPPQALIHDNKPIHDDHRLREHIEKTTKMIPATVQRPENKAVIEGEFGKYEQAVGTIYLDDSSKNELTRSAVREILRAYTAGLNHAGRAEFNGKSRQQVLRATCPDPDKDSKFIEQLHCDHTETRRVDVLPTRPASRIILDEGFRRFGIEDMDPDGKTRQWLAERYTPEAIRQGLAIFGTERNKGRLRNKMAHRYLVKVIQNSQEEIDLRRQEESLREFAEIERQGWLQELEAEYKILETECDESTPENDLAIRLSDSAVFGGLSLQRAFWENKLKLNLERNREKFSAVCRHVRRLFEATWENRFALIAKLVAWEYQLTS